MLTGLQVAQLILTGQSIETEAIILHYTLRKLKKEKYISMRLNKKEEFEIQRYCIFFSNNSLDQILHVFYRFQCNYLQLSKYQKVQMYSFHFFLKAIFWQLFNSFWYLILHFCSNMSPKAMFHPQLYMKYQIENWQGIVFFSYGQMKCSLALVGNHLEMVSR